MQQAYLLCWLGIIAQLFFPYWGLAYAGYDPAGIKLPPGFKITTYITRFGFYEDQRGIPAVVSTAFHSDGTLYVD